MLHNWICPTPTNPWTFSQTQLHKLEETDAAQALALLRAINEKRFNQYERLLNYPNAPLSCDDEYDMDQSPLSNSLSKLGEKYIEANDELFIAQIERSILLL